MLRPGLLLAVTLAVAAFAAGCGGGSHASTTASTTTGPRVSAAACGELRLDVQFISQLIENSVEAMATSVHPKQLAHRTAAGQQSLLVAVRLVERFKAPPALARPRMQLADGLRRYAADFGRARHAVAKTDMATASAQLNDLKALGEVKSATKTINRTCRA